MKNFTKLFGIIALIAVVGFSMSSCENNPGGEPGPGGDPTEIEGIWFSAGSGSSTPTEAFMFTGRNVTLYSGSQDAYRGTFTLEGDADSEQTINITYTSWSGDGGANFGNRNQYLEAATKAWFLRTGAESAWNALSGAQKQTLIDQYLSSNLIKDPPASRTATYAIINNGNTLNLVTGGTARAYAKILPIEQPGAITLTTDQWTDGHITPSSGGEVWYKFNVTSGTTYRLWWNESGSGGSTNPKTLDISVSAYYPNGLPIFSGVDTAWSSAQSFTANSNNTVYLRVSPYTSGNTGSFGILYTGTQTTRPAIPFAPAGVVALTDGVWADGQITGDMDGVAWFSFNATSARVYSVWWNDGYSSTGNGTKTLDIYVAGFDQTGTQITGFGNTDNGWDTPKTLTATYTGPVYFRVTPYTSGRTGTFGIVYTEGGSGTPRPDISIDPPDVVTLEVNEWEDGEIQSGDTGEAWYKFTAAAGTYYVWLNGSSGSGTKTLNARVSAWFGNGTSILSSGSPWSSGAQITLAETGTVYLRVIPYSSTGSGSTGTFGIAYSDSNTRPDGAMERPGVILLAEDQAADGVIASGGATEVWYKINVTSGKFYSIRLNASGGGSYGDGTKTLNARLSIYNSNGTSIATDRGQLWTSPYLFIAGRNTTIYIRVYPSGSGNNGTFGVEYNIITPVALTEEVWTDGEVSQNGEQWFSFTATITGLQYIHVNFGTLSDLYVEVYNSTGTQVGSRNNLYGSNKSANRTLTSGEVYYIKIYPYYSTYSGTFNIAFNTSSTAPTGP